MSILPLHHSPGGLIFPILVIENEQLELMEATFSSKLFCAKVEVDECGRK